MTGKRRLIDIIGIGVDVLLWYTPMGLALFRTELEAYLNERGWTWRR